MQTTSESRSTVGETAALPNVTSTPRRAMPFVMGEAGSLESISIYHDGGTGKVLLAVYDDYGPDGVAGTSDDGLPGNRLGMTPRTSVTSSAGWQTVALSETVDVLAGETIWLAWVFEHSVKVRWDHGSPGRADSGQSWSSGAEPMPGEFGASSQAGYIYSIYALYALGQSRSTVGETAVLPNTTSTPRRAMPFVMDEAGTLESISIYHDGGTGNVVLAVYDDYGPDGVAGTSDDGSPGNRLGMTPRTSVTSSAGWQTVALSETVDVLEGQTIWLAWVFEHSVKVRWDYGSPGRADSGQSWSSGAEPMPGEFGTSSQAGYIYSVYALYAPGELRSTAEETGILPIAMNAQISQGSNDFTADEHDLPASGLVGDIARGFSGYAVDSEDEDEDVDLFLSGL